MQRFAELRRPTCLSAKYVLLGGFFMRRPKPFFRKQTQSWYVQIGKKQINLGKDEGQAWDQYHKIMTQRESVDVPDDAICNILNRYLDWVKQARADETYKKCRLHLRRFAQHIGRSAVRRAFSRVYSADRVRYVGAFCQK